jgi:muramoyltetrapeptide carboxypeptidase
MVLIDPPNAAGHGRLWSHLASDTSFEELHEFARGLGIPERGFDRDHYDVPS